MSQINMPNTYSDEEWNDLTVEERAQSLQQAEWAHHMDDEERNAIQGEIAELHEQLSGETDYDVIRDIEREISDLEEALSLSYEEE